MAYKASMFTRLRQTIAACLAIFPLVGCGPTGFEDPYREYLQRLSRTLDQSFTHPAIAPPERMPRPARLRHEFEAGNLDGLDFLALHGCELQLTVGKKNSSLGRMARDSQRLLLDLEYLQLAPGCIAQLQEEGKQALAATLQQAWRDKRRQLPQRVFNATLGATEYRSLWQPDFPGDHYPDNTSSAPLQALGRINAMVERWLGGDYRFDNRAFEIMLSEVAKGDGGQLWYSLAIQAAWLERADAMLRSRQRRGALCADNYRADAADILPRVIARFFVDGTQATSAKLGRRYHQLLPPVQALEQLLATALPAAYITWKSGRDSALAEFSAAPREHVSQLQALLAPCDRKQR